MNHRTPKGHQKKPLVMTQEFGSSYKSQSANIASPASQVSRSEAQKLITKKRDELNMELM